jgi:hypothetical protein
MSPPSMHDLMREYLLLGARLYHLWDTGRGETEEAGEVKTRRTAAMALMFEVAGSREEVEARIGSLFGNLGLSRR